MRLCRVVPKIVIALILVSASVATAQEQFQLMSMPTSYTEVIGAFDGADPLDVNVRAGFLRTSRSGTIQRENVQIGPTGERSTQLVDVAHHSRVTNTLKLGLDVGIYRDLALFIGLPLVLRDSRELSLPDGMSQSSVDAVLTDAPPGGGTADPLLFHVPFKPPARSGIPAVHFGMAWAPSNQHRSRNLPTWVLMLETRLATASVLKACNDSCDKPGVSDGTSAVRLESRTSYRYRYVEPYIGLSFELPWVSTGTELFASDQGGLVRRQPPRVSEATLGAALIPWEDRERFQRVAFDLRLTGAYISAGRDITPLFDALGTSVNPYLSEPNYDRLDADPTQRSTVNMTGATDTTARARIGFQGATVIQAARYIRFVMGLGFAYTSPYFLTGADACNPSVGVGSDDTRRGGCASGILNPAHRPAIDVSGKRFKLDGELMFNLFASATAQF